MVVICMMLVVMRMSKDCERRRDGNDGDDGDVDDGNDDDDGGGGGEDGDGEWDTATSPWPGVDASLRPAGEPGKRARRIVRTTVRCAIVYGGDTQYKLSNSTPEAYRAPLRA